MVDPASEQANLGAIVYCANDELGLVWDMTAITGSTHVRCWSGDVLSLNKEQAYL